MDKISKFNYKNLTPFKWCVIQSFPFIEADFDAITEYQLLCKVVEYLNKNIDNINEMGEQVELLSNNFIQLKNYIDDYFKNLNVQDEINNKLNEMAQDGSLYTVLNQFLQDNATIMIGDSYGVGYTPDGNVNSWCDNLKYLMNLSDNNYYKFVNGGASFVYQNNSFLKLLQDNINLITDKLKIRNIIVCGGYNDNGATALEIYQAIYNFVQYCKQNFPNAKIYIGMIGNTSQDDVTGALIRNNIKSKVLYSYQTCNQHGAVYLNGVENALQLDYNSMISSDKIHPTATGYVVLAGAIYNALNGGYTLTSANNPAFLTFENNININDTNFRMSTIISNNIVSICSDTTNIAFNNPINANLAIKLGTIKTANFLPVSRIYIHSNRLLYV